MNEDDDDFSNRYRTEDFSKLGLSGHDPILGVGVGRPLDGAILWPSPRRVMTVLAENGIKA